MDYSTKDFLEAFLKLTPAQQKSIAELIAGFAEANGKKQGAEE